MKAELKLIITWDLCPGTENDAEYFELVSERLGPTLSRMGLEVSDAWMTIYGNTPQVLLSALIPDERTAEEKLSRPEWLHLVSELEEHVENFQIKVVFNREEFQF